MGKKPINFEKSTFSKNKTPLLGIILVILFALIIFGNHFLKFFLYQYQIMLLNQQKSKLGEQNDELRSKLQGKYSNFELEERAKNELGLVSVPQGQWIAISKGELKRDLDQNSQGEFIK